jgi:hypothetical protein
MGFHEGAAWNFTIPISNRNRETLPPNDLEFAPRDEGNLGQGGDGDGSHVSTVASRRGQAAGFGDLDTLANGY